MKIFYRIIFILIFQSAPFNQQSFSQQAPGIEWQNTIGGGLRDDLRDIQQTSDGGYILGGFSHSNISGDKAENNWDSTLSTNDYWIVKTDVSGNILWQNTIGGSGDDHLFSIRQTTDGGYILGGLSLSNISGDKTENCIGGSTWPDYWIVKTDSIGNIQWQNTIGGNSGDQLHCIQQTIDGGYILGGSSKSNISGDKTENSWSSSEDYWIVKTDISGNIQWQNTIGGSGDDVLLSIQQTNDGGYILGGFSWSNISGDKTENSIGYYDYWMVKINGTGIIQWQNTIGGDMDDLLFSIRQTIDGGYILGGLSRSNISGDKVENSNGGDDYWIVKTNASGNIQWQNTIGGNDQDILMSMQQTAEGGYILGGGSLSNISGDKTENNSGYTDFWIVKINSSGNIQWQNTIGGNYWEEFYSIKQTVDGGYILGGNSQSNISGDKTENCIGFYDFWIIKLFPDTITGIIKHQNQTSNIQISPNPFTTSLTIKGTTQKGELIIFDVTGKEILRAKTFDAETKINTAHLTPGFYLVRYSEENKTVNMKVIKAP